MRSTFLLSTVIASLVLASSATAFAQEESSETTEDQPKPKKKKVEASTTTTTTTTAAASGSEKADHDLVVGKIGIGYLGSLATPLGVKDSLSAHIIGMRYWFNPGMGLTAGIGFGTTTGSFSSNGTNTDMPAASTFALKGGLPIALTTGKHYAFVIEPQLVFGYSTQTQNIPNGGGTIENTGYRFALGGTAGGEIHFGFIGIPELSLIGSVGLAFDTVGGKTKNSPTGSASTETAFSQTSVATFTRENPWDIFKASVAAVYYF